MCMWFKIQLLDYFYHFFHFVNLVIFRPQCIDSGYLVSTTPHTVLYQSFWNFAHVFSMVWRCACGLDIILALILLLFPLCELCHFVTSDSMKMLWQWVPCECNSSYNFIPTFLKLCTCFSHGLEICVCFGYNPWINFYYFSTLWTLSFSDLRFYESVETVGILWVQLLIQFYTILYETLQMFLPWSGDVHMVWI